MIETTPNDTTIITNPLPSRFNPVIHLLLMIGAGIVSLLVVFVIFTFIFVYIPARNFLSQLQQVQAKESKIKAVLVSKDLNQIKSLLSELKTDQANLQTSYNRLSILKNIPYAKNYYQDGREALNIS